MAYYGTGGGYLGNALLRLQAWGLSDVILPFILIFTVVFAVMQRVKPLGDAEGKSKAFSVVLAGGSLQTGQAVGVTDELGRNVVERPVSVADLHATIYSALGVDPAEELYDGDRPVPITDHGKPVSELFS